MSSTVAYGLYGTRSGLEKAVDALRRGGFRNTVVSVLTSEAAAAAGQGSGTATGGALDWLAGMGLLVIPGIGSFFAAGPVLALLAGVGRDKAMGSIVRALMGLGISEFEAKRCEGRIEGGDILISVHCDSAEWVRRTEELFRNTGAADVASSVGEAWAQPAPVIHV